MQYIGIDLAWSQNNYSGVALLENNKVVYVDILKTIDDISSFINTYPKAKVGVDAPLVVPNKNGTRAIEKEFLKDFSSKKLGIYPVNRTLLEKINGSIAGEDLRSKIYQKLGVSLFEVYPHVTIMQCFHGLVLPYKRKKGRNTAFIKEQLNILQNYLLNNIDGDFAVDISKLKGQSLKHHEDKLDSIVSAYTLYYCDKYKCKTYGDIFKVPIKL
ncbi:MAG: DUF429 domain-containing protein [Campylobacterota bacterium]|nr:DUF429 domain-containing protein [Campylobacterota bacterium]